MPLLQGNVLRILQIFLLDPEQRTAVTRKLQVALWNEYSLFKCKGEHNMFNSKVNHMTVIVKGVRDDDYEGRELMMEVVRRNCKMDPRLVSQMVYSIRTYEDGKKKRTDFNVEFEAFDMGGIIRDFKLLKKAGVIKQVEKKQYTNYLVY